MYYYDLAKWLGHYLYLLFFFFSFELTTQGEVWESATSQVLHKSQSHDKTLQGHLLKKEWLEVRTTQVAEVIIDGVDLLEKIRGSEAKDNEVVKVVEEMK